MLNHEHVQPITRRQADVHVKPFRQGTHFRLSDLGNS